MRIPKSAAALAFILPIAENEDIKANNPGNMGYFTSPKQDSSLEKNFHYHSSEYADSILAPVEYNTLDRIKSFLNSFEELEVDWGVKGSYPPSEKVIKDTVTFLNLLPNEYVNFIDEESIAPTPYGTITLDFNDYQTSISIEIGDEQIGYFVEKDGEFVSESNGLKLNKYNVLTFVLKEFQTYFPLEFV